MSEITSDENIMIMTKERTFGNGVTSSKKSPPRTRNQVNTATATNNDDAGLSEFVLCVALQCDIERDAGVLKAATSESHHHEEMKLTGQHKGLDSVPKGPPIIVAATTRTHHSSLLHETNHFTLAVLVFILALSNLATVWHNAVTLVLSSTQFRFG